MIQSIQSEIARWKAAEEGQFFERKAGRDRSGRHPKLRKAKEIAWDIAETLSAMANADGGELILGMENDGKVTGVALPEDKIRLLLGVPNDRNYVSPPLPFEGKEMMTPEGLRLLHFDVSWSPDVHQLADGRYLLRVRDRNEPFDANRIRALKDAKSQGLFERSFPPGATLADINLDLVQNLLGSIWLDLSTEDILHRYNLIESRNGHAVPTIAALLLFGRHPSRWHSRCGIDFVRWEGTERRHGDELNVIKRFPIEAPLALLIKGAREGIQPFIRERRQLYDLFFAEKLEYPTFAWQEAIVNAVAHRDYSIQGAPIEVWMFDDHMEVRSPGLPPAPITIEALNRREHIHLSRNPLMVRVLADLRYMQDQGEGIPRMFDVMERAGCYPPKLEIVGGFAFQVTLRNEPVYDRPTLEWLGRFKEAQLSGNQKRMLAYAHAHGNRFTSREYQRVIGIDIYGASGEIKDMIRKGVARSMGKGSRIYIVQEPLQAAPEMPLELKKLLPSIRRKGYLRNDDIQKTLSLSRITAWRLIISWVDEGWLSPQGKGRGRRYEPGPRFSFQSQNVSNAPEGET